MWIHSKIARMHKHYQAIDLAFPSNRPSITKHSIPYRPFHFVDSIIHSIPFHSIPFHSIPFRSIPFHSIPYHSTFHFNKKKWNYCSISVPFINRRLPPPQRVILLMRNYKDWFKNKSSLASKGRRQRNRVIFFGCLKKKCNLINNNNFLKYWSNTC